MLQTLKDAGMDSLPEAAAEILSDRVRRLISRANAAVKVARHHACRPQKGMTTSATMMFSISKPTTNAWTHLVRIREVQAQKPEGHGLYRIHPWLLPG